jgi:hypothetical protein
MINIWSVSVLKLITMISKETFLDQILAPLAFSSPFLCHLLYSGLPRDLPSLVTYGHHLLGPRKLHFVLPNLIISFHCKSEGIS